MEIKESFYIFWCRKCQHVRKSPLVIANGEAMPGGQMKVLISSQTKITLVSSEEVQPKACLHWKGP